MSTTFQQKNSKIDTFDSHPPKIAHRRWSSIIHSWSTVAEMLPNIIVQDHRFDFSESFVRIISDILPVFLTDFYLLKNGHPRLFPTWLFPLPYWFEGLRFINSRLHFASALNPASRIFYRFQGKSVRRRWQFRHLFGFRPLSQSEPSDFPASINNAHSSRVNQIEATRAAHFPTFIIIPGKHRSIPHLW